MSMFFSHRLSKSVFLLWAVGLWLALVQSPADFQQGNSMRILYVHVPTSWAALALLTVMAGASAVFLIFRLPRADILAEALAPLGALVTVLSLLTGALWGGPVWGSFWVWDARVTSMTLLLLLYGGIMGLRRAFVSPFAAQQPVALLTLVAWINVPLIKGSVYWFYTLHQPPSLFRTGGPTLHPQMVWPLLVMTAAVAATLFLLARQRVHLIALRYKMKAYSQRNQGVLIWEKSSPP